MASTDRLRVIALVSGGKDSMYSMLHCLSHGHEIVALANLYPHRQTSHSSSPSAQDAPHGQLDERKGADGDDEADLNSFMFQTVGHSVIPLYSSALSSASTSAAKDSYGIPLYRQPISGTAVSTAKEYSPSGIAEDETEDIFALLAEVKRAHPDANSVSTGAILSTYQRTRVESVALRLSLIPLSFLWQYPTLSFAAGKPASTPAAQAKGRTKGSTDPAVLLRHMAAMGIDARIIKVASGGLDDSFLWQNVCDEASVVRIGAAVGKFGGSVLGEGGEYETLVVGGPRPLWAKVIHVGDDQRKIIRGESGEAWINFGRGQVADMLLSGNGEGERGLHQLVRPNLFDDCFSAILETVSKDRSLQRPAAGRRESGPILVGPAAPLSAQTCEVGPVLKIVNLSTPTGGEEGRDLAPISAQVMQICTKLVSILSEHGCSASSLVHVTILLRSMAYFAPFNAAYGGLFDHPLPPSRVTVACGSTMPATCSIMLSAIASLDQQVARIGLHVQSRSYWAPANIGPYSQARSIAAAVNDGGKEIVRLVYVAGQIPLLPATMQVIDGASNGPEMRKDAPWPQQQQVFARQAVLALQHLWRIGLEQRVGCWTGAVAFLAASEHFDGRARTAWQAWRAAHEMPDLEEDEEDVDVWDQRNLKQQLWATTTQDDANTALPDWERVDRRLALNCEQVASYAAPGFFAVEVDELPRSVDIEWQSTGFACVSAAVDRGRFMVESRRSAGGLRLRTVAYRESGGGGDALPPSVLFIEVHPGWTGNLEAVEELVSDTRKATGGSFLTVYAAANHDRWQRLGAQVIPCRRIKGPSGEDLVAGAILAPTG